MNVKEQFPTKNIRLVFGCGGDRDKGKRSLMGRIASEYADFIYLTDDNPRNENENDIISDIINGVVDDNYEIEIDRKIAIKMAFQKFKTNSIILVAGKGHEKYQIIGDKSLPHDDKEIIKELIL